MPALSRRSVAGGLIAIAAAPMTRPHAQAGWPEKAVKVVVPFAAGGGADILARLLAPKMGEGLGQPMIIDNRPGAGTTIANDIVAKAAPDGYTLLQVNRDMTISPSTYASLPYDTLKSFAWIGKAADGPFVLVANKDLPVKSLAELAALARSKPGQISYGNLAIGGIAHLNVEAMMRHLGINLLQVPYKGAAPALAAIVTGEIAVALVSLASCIPFVRDGRVRALGVGFGKRVPHLPDVPTIAEAGGGDTVLPFYAGLAAPAGTPRPIIDKLSAELKRAVAHREVVEKIEQNGLIPAFTTPEELGEIVARDIANFGRLVKEIGIQPQ